MTEIVNDENKDIAGNRQGHYHAQHQNMKIDTNEKEGGK